MRATSSALCASASFISPSQRNVVPFCKDCIIATISKKAECPLCRRRLAGNAKNYAINYSLERIMEHIFGARYKDRRLDKLLGNKAKAYLDDAQNSDDSCSRQ